MSTPDRRRASVLFLVSLIVMSLALVTGAAPRRPSKPPPEQDSFTDHLQVYDTSRWMKADGWKNGSPFDNAWSASNVIFEGGDMILQLDDTALLGEPYTSGHYQTLGFHGYGCYEASFKPVAVRGAVTSFFTFAGPYDNGGNGKHNEIDIEFLGYDTSIVQLNFYTNGDTRRDTKTDGVATFYSARSRASGTVTFCVTDVTRAGSTYDALDNWETCDSISK